MKTAADIFSQLNGLRLSDGTSAGERLRTTVTPPSQPSSSSAQSQGVFAFALPKAPPGPDLQQQIQQIQQQQQQAGVVIPSSSSSSLLLSTPPTTRPAAQRSLSQMLLGNAQGSSTSGGHGAPPPYPGSAAKEARTNHTNTTATTTTFSTSNSNSVSIGGMMRTSSRAGVATAAATAPSLVMPASSANASASPVIAVPAGGFATSNAAAAASARPVRVAAQQITTTTSSSTNGTTSSNNTNYLSSHLPPTAPLPNVRTGSLRPNELPRSPCVIPQLHTPSLRSSSGVNSPASLNDVMGPPLGNANSNNNSNNSGKKGNNGAFTAAVAGGSTGGAVAAMQANGQRGGRANGPASSTPAAPVTAAINGTSNNNNNNTAMTRPTMRSPVVEQLKAVAPSAAFTTSPVKAATLQPYSPVGTAAPAVAPSAAATSYSSNEQTIIAGNGEALNPKVLEFFHNARGLATNNSSGSTTMLNGGNAMNGESARQGKPPLAGQGTNNNNNNNNATATSSSNTLPATSHNASGSKAGSATNAHSSHTAAASSSSLPQPRHEQTAAAAARQAVSTHNSHNGGGGGDDAAVNEAELRAKIASAVTSGNASRAAAAASSTNSGSTNNSSSNKTGAKTSADHAGRPTAAPATSNVQESSRRETHKANNNTVNNSASSTNTQGAAAVNAFLPAAFGDKELLDNTAVQKPLIRQLPAIPADGRYIIIGDVHGCVEQLEALVAKVKYVPGRDCLVIIGDFVNKGPDSIGVIRACQRLKILGVLGNHDYTLLKCCARHRRKPYCPDDLRDPVKRLAKDFPLDCELYLRGLPHMLRLPAYNLLLVHAGLNIEHSIEEQSMIEIMHLRRLEKVAGSGNNNSNNNNNTASAPASSGSKNAKTSSSSNKGSGSAREHSASNGHATQSEDSHREHYVAITKGQAGTPWAELWPGPEHVIFGHDAFAGFQAHRFAYGIDTGCVYGDPLTCVVFSATTPQGEFYSVPGLPRHANELMGLPPPNSDIYEQLQMDLERHIIRPTTRSTPMQLLPGSPALFASTPADFVGPFQLGPAAATTTNHHNNNNNNNGSFTGNAFPAHAMLGASVTNTNNNNSGGSMVHANGVGAGSPTATVCGPNYMPAETTSNGSPNASLTKPLTSPTLSSARKTHPANDAALANASPSLHMLQAALNEAAMVSTYEVQKATLLALAAAHELRALGVVLAMPVYEKDVDAMMTADAVNETAQQAFWSPFARGVLEAAAANGTHHESPEEVEDVVRLVLSVCETMARVRREVTPMLRAMLDTSEATQPWSRSIQKHITIVLQD